jgi:hypothetical protein
VRPPPQQPSGALPQVVFRSINVTGVAPGSLRGLHLIVSDTVEARNALLRQGFQIIEVYHDAGGVFHHARAADLVSGPNPQCRSYASYASFSGSARWSYVIRGSSRHVPVCATVSNNSLRFKIDKDTKMDRAIQRRWRLKKRRPGIDLSCTV